jgi:hypothetical protein
MMNPDRNPVLKLLVKLLFYNTFAAGESSVKVKGTIDNLRKMGCYGVILGYARETMEGHSQSQNTPSQASLGTGIAQWKAGNLQTVEMVGENDLVSIKYVELGTWTLPAELQRTDKY